MLEQIQGDFFKIAIDEKVQAMVNPVNCAGVMGAGLALEFRYKFPRNYKIYQERCSTRRLRPGHLTIVQERAEWVKERPPIWVINFPTKDHWKDPSSISYITSTLEILSKQIQSLEISSIAIPRLGCGLGGLNWDIHVKYYVDQYLAPLKNTRVIVVYKEEEYPRGSRKIRH